MTLKVVLRRAARVEFDDAVLWYEARRVGLGTDFKSEVDRVIDVVARDPKRFPFGHRDIRCARIRRFPYTICYRIEPDRIVVLAAFHARRDPAVWRTRA